MEPVAYTIFRFMFAMTVVWAVACGLILGICRPKKETRRDIKLGEVESAMRDVQRNVQSIQKEVDIRPDLK